jgi:hypothetical protein
MMAFFFTMPISSRMPMVAISVRSLPEQHQRGQRPHRRRGQARQDGDGVDVALVQHAQQHVDHQQRGDDQDQLAALRALEYRRVAAIGADHRRPASAIASRSLVDLGGGIAQRRARAPG